MSSNIEQNFQGSIPEPESERTADRTVLVAGSLCATRLHWGTALDRARILQLVQDLGSKSYQTRRMAMGEILRNLHPELIVALLEHQAPDEKTHLRMQQILRDPLALRALRELRAHPRARVRKLVDAHLGMGVG